MRPLVSVSMRRLYEVWGAKMTNKTEIGHCRDCMFWHPYHEGNLSGTIGACLVINKEHLFPVNTKDADEGWPVEITFSGVDTFPNFGCIHWKEKEAA